MQIPAVPSTTLIAIFAVGLLALILHYTDNYAKIIKILGSLGTNLKSLGNVNAEQSEGNISPMASKNQDVEQVNYILVNASENDDMDWIRDLVSDGDSETNSEKEPDK